MLYNILQRVVVALLGGGIGDGWAIVVDGGRLYLSRRLVARRKKCAGAKHFYNTKPEAGEGRVFVASCNGPFFI